MRTKPINLTVNALVEFMTNHIIFHFFIVIGQCQIYNITR